MHKTVFMWEVIGADPTNVRKALSCFDTRILSTSKLKFHQDEVLYDVFHDFKGSIHNVALPSWTFSRQVSSFISVTTHNSVYIPVCLLHVGVIDGTNATSLRPNLGLGDRWDELCSSDLFFHSRSQANVSISGYFGRGKGSRRGRRCQK